MKIGKKPEESVGLDIGGYSIKVVSVTKENGESTLNSYNIKKIPFDEKDKKALNMTTLIKETLDEVDIKPERVNLSIYGTDVIVRFINLPKMDKDQLENAFVFEAEKYIPFNINEVVLDFLILGDAPEEGQMKVLLAAAKREPIETQVKIIEDLGMMVNVMDISPFAMFNAFLAATPNIEDSGIALLGLGHSQTDVLISTGKLPAFMRQIQIGGKDITKSISRNMSVDFNKAESLKMGKEEGDSETINQITEQVLDDMVNEIQLSFGYFENAYNSAISNIYCSGGLVYQQKVLEYLSGKLGTQIKLWNPIDGIKVSDVLSRDDLNSIASQLAVSIGLAIRD